jgi:hypothetical protein
MKLLDCQPSALNYQLSAISFGVTDRNLLARAENRFLFDFRNRPSLKHDELKAES